MTITPVSNLSLKSNGSINFTRRHRDFEPDSVSYQPERSSGMAKKVPVIVLLAMSPLNSSSVEPYNPNYMPNNIEMVQQSESKRVLQRELHDGNESIRFLAYSNDGNEKDFENFYFNYDNKIGNKKGLLAGKVIAVCAMPRNDGRYLMAYKPIDDNYKLGKDFQLCYVPDVFGAYLNSYAKGWANNGALGSVPKSEFEEYFGINNVKNAPLIKDRVTRYKPIK